MTKVFVDNEDLENYERNLLLEFANWYLKDTRSDRTKALLVDYFLEERAKEEKKKCQRNA